MPNNPDKPDQADSKKCHVEDLEWEWAVEHHGIGYDVAELNSLVGFITSTGLVVAVPEKKHDTFLSALSCLGIDRDAYQRDYGAIRVRSDGQSANVEIMAEPTHEQLTVLSRFGVRIHHDIWGSVWSRCPKSGVSPHRLLLDIRAFSENGGFKPL
jgi:hypothetical protein